MDASREEIIPFSKELGFIFKLVSVIAAGSILCLMILALLTNKPLDEDYRFAFQALYQIYSRMNYYIAISVLVQLVFSSIFVYFIALLYSHKLAGPMFRLKTVVRQLLEDQSIEKVSFRSTDFLQDIAREFSEFFQFLNTRRTILNQVRQVLTNVDLNDEEHRILLPDKIAKLMDKMESHDEML